MHMFSRSHVTQQHHHAGDALQVFCAFPLSEPYQLMPRVLLYPLLWLAFWSRTAFVAVILWTSVAAIHVVALATTHDASVLDIDMLPAYTQVLLGLIAGPALITLSRGLNANRRADTLAACLWLVLLWAAMVSYVSTTKFQPTTMPCIDQQSRNITSQALLSQCTFQCTNVTTTHPMRLGQSASVIAVPAHFWAGHGETDHMVILWTAFMGPYVLFAFWMASKGSFTRYAQAQVQMAKGKKAKEDATKLVYLAPKIAVWGFVLVVWFGEVTFKNFPPYEKKDSISQWGLLVAFGVGVVGLFLRLLSSIPYKKLLKLDKSEYQTDQLPDTELGSIQQVPLLQPPQTQVTEIKQETSTTTVAV